jgi:acetolactate synthase-1/2/3 large subunit
MTSGAEAVVEALKRAGVDVLFGIPSIHNIGLYDALRREQAIRHILCRQEATAVHMADGYARESGSPGVVITSTGPGAGYAVPAFEEALGSCSPLVMITTNVASKKIGKMTGTLHEVADQHLIFENISKAVLCAREGDDVGGLTEEALRIAVSGRPGPVCLEIPTDLFGKPVSKGSGQVLERKDESPALPDIDKALSRLRDSKRPLIVAGTGAVRAGIAEEIKVLAEALAAPVITTTNGKGIIPEDHVLSLGNATRKGIIREIAVSSDAAIAVGTRLREADAKRRGLMLPRLIHVDWDSDWFNKNFKAEIGLAGDMSKILETLLKKMGPVSGREERMALMRENKEKLEQEIDGIKKSEKELLYLYAVRGCLSRESTFVIDNTQLAYWAEYFYPSYCPGGLMSARGATVIGFSFPAAIGAKIASPQKQVAAIIGDGGFLYGTHELSTCMRHGIGFPLIVVNDGTFGVISYLQRTFYGNDYEADLVNPDFVALAKAYGARAERVDSPEGLSHAMEKALSSCEMYVIELVDKFPDAVFGKH